MRVGVLGRCLGHRMGIGRYARLILDALAADGSSNEYVLFCNHNGYSPQARQQVVRSTCRNPISVLLWENLGIPRALARTACDVFYNPDFVLPFRCPCRSVVTVHDMAYARLPQFTGWKARAYYGAFVGRSVRRADRIITVSHHSRKDILESFPGLDEMKVVVVYEGPGHTMPAAEDGERARRVRERLGLTRDYILYVGLLGGWKNVEGLVAAYALARRKGGLRADLVLAGKTCRSTASIVAEIQRQGLGDEVHLLGFVADEDLPFVYQGASLFVFPSLYEGFGLPPLEAMSCGVPTIVSNTTALAEVAGPGALMVNPRDKNEIADAMVAVLRDDSLARELRERGLKRAAEFSWDRAARETLSVFEEVHTR